MWSRVAMAELGKWFPRCGPCAFCGHKDKRHRMWDTMLGMLDGGDSVELVATNYCVPVEAVEAVQRIRPYHRRKEVRDG